MLWRNLQKYYRMGFLMGCANTVIDPLNNQVQGEGDMGILNNHAYAIQQIKDVDGLKLIRIRNPWGKAEWKGRFSDGSKIWDSYRGLKGKLEYEF